ncbi:MAG TPA: hypothetical protein VM686_26305 [Polyangiaceae bacterium]|nr:hypothetical protein [Polyangiaceae bacterium]
MKRKPRGPGLKKTGAVALIHSRTMELLQSTDYGWRELFESADVMSEGATRSEPDGKKYYGSTSVLLPLVSKGGRVPDAQADAIANVVARDPHARLRAVRIACVEAQVRSIAPIGRVRAELFVRRDSRGIRVDVEVEANVFEGHEARPPHEQPTPSKRSSRAS